MSFIKLDETRRVVPRWRSFTSTSQTGELNHHAARVPSDIDSDPFFRAHVARWQSERSIESAAELLAFSLVVGKSDVVQEVASYVVKNRHLAADALIHVAQRVLTAECPASGSESTITTATPSFGFINEAVVRQIHDLRRRLASWPRNAIFWVDLSRLYTILGEEQKAISAMRAALHLSPSNRFVVRSASRLAVHLNDPEYAQAVLASASRDRLDPWILAPEIAVSCILGKSSRFLKKAQQILKSGGFLPQHVSELAGSLGTFELTHGDRRAAKKLFTKSLVFPNDNVLAQAEWAISRVGELDTHSRANVPCSYEANTRHALRNGDWESALVESARWAVDEPFSSGPIVFGSYVATSMLERCDVAVEFCRLGLKANSSDFDIRNNLIVALANLGRLCEAEREFASILRVKISEGSQNAAVFMATSGLLDFRRGNIERGRAKYLEAIELAGKLNDRKLLAMARLYHAREELRARTPISGEYVAKAMMLTKNTKDLEILHMGEILEKECRQSES